MIKIRNNLFCHTFEYLYLFVMVIYMAQMTKDTGRMVGALSGNPIPFLIPIILTIFLLLRHPIDLKNKKLWQFASIMFCWSFAVCYKFHDFGTENLSYYFFLFYAFFIAYIHVRVYGRDLFDIYEHIMVVFSAISLVLWGAGLLLPSSGHFFRLFSQTPMGNNVLYLFQWLDPGKEVEPGYSLRNAGCSWEPGRFAIMLVPAILINLSREGIRFRRNKKMIILLLALASTMSTTGYSVVIILFSLFWIEKKKIFRIITFVLLLVPASYYLFTLDFMGEKIQDRIEFEEINDYNYYERTYGDEYVGSIDRFQSASLEWVNFQEEPLLGYGRNTNHSWFRQEVTQNFVLTGGLVKILSQYGAFVGLLLYIILFYSSIKISRLFPHQRKFAFALAILLCSISYPVFSIPIFTAFWLYGLLCDRADVEDRHILVYRKERFYT